MAKPGSPGDISPLARTLRRFRPFLWAAAFVAGTLAVAVAVVLYTLPGGQRSGMIGGPFALERTDGTAFTEANVAGAPYAIFFGFTNCPDVCPTTLFEAKGWLDALGPDADKIKFLFVTVDPERDTPEQLASYMSAFDPRLIGLTGSSDAVAAAIRSYRVYARKVPLDDGGYTMDHSASVLLFDGKGDFAGTIDYQEATDTAVAKLKRLVTG